MTNSATEAASAIRRIHTWSSERSSSSAATLSSGRNVITVSKRGCVPTLVHHQSENAEQEHGETHSADHDPRCVAARISLLQLADFSARFLGRARGAVHNSVDQALVHAVPENVCGDPKQG